MANRFVLNTISYHGSGAIKEIPGELQRRGYKKQAIAEDAAVAETVEETGATPGLDEAAKAAEREARRQALYEENERAEDERARAEAERMRDVDDEDEDETPRDTWATVRRLWSEAAGDHWRFYIVFASIVFYVIFNTAAPAYSARVIDELWGHMKLAFANNTTFSITWENCGRTIFIYFMIWTAAASFYALQSFLMSSVAERLNLRLRNRIAQKLNRLPLAYFDAHRPGEVVSRATNDLDKMSESMQRGLLQLLVSIGTVVGAVSVMFVFSVPLTLVLLFFTALSLLSTLGDLPQVGGRQADPCSERPGVPEPRELAGLEHEVGGRRGVDALEAAQGVDPPPPPGLAGLGLDEPLEPRLLLRRPPDRVDVVGEHVVVGPLREPNRLDPGPVRPGPVALPAAGGHPSRRRRARA